jgi:hypothetical protein
VIYAVRREASAPPPIPFPWKRALPALVAGALALIALTAAVVHSAGDKASAASAQPSFMSTLARAVDVANMYGIGWIVLAVLVTLTSLAFSIRLTTGSWRTL